jgi:hypothetical protein
MRPLQSTLKIAQKRRITTVNPRRQGAHSAESVSSVLGQFCFNWIIETPVFSSKPAGRGFLPAAWGRSAPRAVSTRSRRPLPPLAPYNLMNLLF